MLVDFNVGTIWNDTCFKSLPIIIGMITCPIISTVSPFATIKLCEVALDIGWFELRIFSRNSLPTYECVAPVLTNIIYKLFSNFIIT